MLDLNLHAPASVSMNENQLQTVKNVIQGYIDDGKNYGASLIVARKGKIVLKQCFGTADGTKPLDDDSVFMMMSGSKSFTAMLTLKAVEKGLFQLNNPHCRDFS